MLPESQNLQLTFEKGGSNTPIARFRAKNGQPMVVKQYGHEPYDLVTPAGHLNPVDNLPIIESILSLQERLSVAGVNVPEIYFWSNVPEELTYQQATLQVLSTPNDNPIHISDGLPNTRILTIESDAGQLNLKHIFDQDNHPDLNVQLMLQMLHLIDQVPEDCAVDTNPANFTITNSGDMYYVDLAPPKIKVRGYERELYKMIFPQAFRSSLLMSRVRVFLYHDPRGRKLRLWYHLSKSMLPKEIKRYIKSKLTSPKELNV